MQIRDIDDGVGRKDDVNTHRANVGHQTEHIRPDWCGSKSIQAHPDENNRNCVEWLRQPVTVGNNGFSLDASSMWNFAALRRKIDVDACSSAM